MIVVGIPAYNEEKHIAKVVQEAKKYCDRVVVVDDGSKDNTSEFALQAGAEVLVHLRNLGKGQSLRDLFFYAEKLGADILVTMDGDEQHDASEIPLLLDAIISGADIASGSRFLNPEGRQSIPTYRRFGNTILNTVAIKNALRLTDTQCGFRAYKVNILRQIMPSEMGMGADTEILAKAVERGLKIVEVPVSVSYGADTSTYNPVFHALDVFASGLKYYSLRHPLIFYGAPGFTLLIGGMVGGFYAASEYLTQHYLSVVISLVSATLILTGLIGISTGIILFTIISAMRTDIAQQSFQPIIITPKPYIEKIDNIS
ncbi:MAG: glycosyltransferase family 2 protein [Thermoprotei archaeon]